MLSQARPAATPRASRGRVNVSQARSGEKAPSPAAHAARQVIEYQELNTSTKVLRHDRGGWPHLPCGLWAGRLGRGAGVALSESSSGAPANANPNGQIDLSAESPFPGSAADGGAAGEQSDMQVDSPPPRSAAAGGKAPPLPKAKPKGGRAAVALAAAAGAAASPPLRRSTRRTPPAKQH
jgi:hypothetical protein